MTTRIRYRSPLPALIAVAVLAWSVADGAAQYPLGVGPAGRGNAFAPGASFPAPGVNAPAQAEPPAPAYHPTAAAPASPRIVMPALTVPPTARLGPATAQPPANPAPAHPGVHRLSLEDAKQRALANSKLLNIANLNVQAKEYAVRAARADYFPKVTGNVFYFHFNDDLGTVLSGGGRTVTGPRGRTLLTFPTTTVNVSVLNQNSTFTNVNATQPITDLLKVRQGVKIAQADVRIAQAEVEKGIRDLVSGVEQLYWGLLAAQRIRAGAAEGVRGAELMAKTGTLEARTALVEAQQGLQQVEKQVADLQEQMNGLLDLPLCTVLELVEPPLLALPVGCADDVIGLALENSPEIRQAQQTIAKAQAAVAAGKLDYVPSVAVIGGYLNQTAADYIQPNIGYLGVVGTYTFVDWGKRRNTVRQREDLVTMATLKLQQTQADVRQKAQKAFRELQQSQAALSTARELTNLRTEAEKAATAPAALMAAAKARMLAEVDLVKAELAYREAYVQVMSLIDRQGCAVPGHP